MGNKIPLSEPESGDSLDAAKVNNDIGNWQAASEQVGKDEDNLRDQGLDLCNFEANSVCEPSRYISLSTGIIITNTVPLSSIPLRLKMTSVDLSSGSHVLRYSLRYRSLMNYGQRAATSTLAFRNSGYDHHYEFWVFYKYEYNGHVGAGRLPCSLRRVGYRNVTLKAKYLDGSITFTYLFNKGFLQQEGGLVPSSAVLDTLEISVVPRSVSAGSLTVPGEIRIQGFNMQLEHLKR